MTWILTIVGDSVDPTEGPAYMRVPVEEFSHSHSKICNALEQLVCEEFEDGHPHHRVCEIDWRNEDTA